MTIPNKLWRIYLFALLVILPVEYIFRLYVSIKIADSLYFSVRNQIDLVLTIVGIIGLWGYVYKKRYFTKIFWKIFFFVIIGQSFFESYLDIKFTIGINNSFGEIPFSFEDIVDFIMGYGIGIPAYIAIFLYAFRANSMWAHKAQPDTCADRC